MAKCIVIGGGLSGISSAIHLYKLGHIVELIESSPKLGGRTYSFLDKKTNTEIDNGQHILMGMYANTFELLEIFGSLNKLSFQSNLEIEILQKADQSIKLKAPSILYPLNLIIALIGFNVFSLREKFKIVKFLLKIFIISEDRIKKMDALSWLRSNGQSENAINSLWELLCISALNTKLSESSAKLFYTILKKIFFGGNKAATMVLTSAPLGEIFVDPAVKYFNRNNIEFSLSERLVELSIENNIVKNIKTEKREIKDFDFIILAIPPYAITQLKTSSEILPLKYLEMKTSPIITVHIWEKKNTLTKEFIGIRNSPIHWVFNNKNHISVVISAADDLIKLNTDEIMNIVIGELKNFISDFSNENITNFKVLKEKRASLKCTIENEELRKSLKSQITNLTFAGDWTNTGLPGTIEGAILSGKLASREIKS